MQNITLVDAISLWMAGQKLDTLALYGVPVVWLGRGAKIVTFLAGLTAVLDIAGPERVQEFGSRISSTTATRSWKRAVIVTALTGFMLVCVALLAVFGRLLAGEFAQSFSELIVIFGAPVLVVIVVLLLSGYFTPRLIIALGKLLGKPTGERRVRTFALSLLATSLLVDLLAS